VSALVAVGSGLPNLSAQSSLRGVVRDSVRGAPVPSTQIVLTRDTLRPNWDAVPPRLSTLADTKGEFHIPDLSPGKYLLHARMVGYRARWLPVEIGADKEEFVVVRMSGSEVCLGHCGPDPVKLAYARNHRAEWGCQVAELERIESERQHWIETLAYPSAPLGPAPAFRAFPRDSRRLAALIRHVTDRARCRRAGRAYDQEFGATDTHFLVFEAGPVLLVSNPWGGDGTLVLDRQYRVLTRYIVE
jgi:carboxypeptidase family protein